MIGTSAVLTKGFHPTGITEKGVYMGSTFLEIPPLPLPQLDASAMLDSKSYCRKTALPSGSTSISGLDAAKRLAQGKRHFLQTMEKELKKREESRRLYFLKGHGVPIQLLQYQLDTAFQWLERQHGTMDITFRNLSGGAYFDLNMSRTELDGSWASTRDQEWPREWYADMALLMTVMNRMASRLSAVFIEDNTKENNNNNELLLPAMKQWKIRVQKNNALPTQLFPEGSELSPVCEWVPLKPFSSKGRMRISLQGNACVKEPSPVTMSFDAYFDVDSISTL